MDRRKKRGFQSSTNAMHFVAGLTIGACIIAETVSSQRSGGKLRSRSPFFELARVLMRLSHVAKFIVNANHDSM
jgi:hypothetical protein